MKQEVRVQLPSDTLAVIHEMRFIRFTSDLPGGGRVHYLKSDDVRVLLGRLPEELWSRLREVHFSDEALGNRRLGYVTPARREISICALPRNMSLGRGCRNNGCSPRVFGALPRRQWPERAVRRYLLYNTFLHEIGHMQVVDPDAKEPRRRFAGETKAQQFAELWRKRLWTERFEHPDPVHNAPTQAELEILEYELQV